MSSYDAFPGDPDAGTEQPRSTLELYTNACLMLGASALLSAGAESDAGLQPEIINLTAMGGAALVAVGLAVKSYRYVRGRLSGL